MPLASPTVLRFGWHVANDGERPLELRSASAPDPAFRAVEVALSERIEPGLTARFGLDIELAPGEPGTDLRNVHLVVICDDGPDRWRATATVDVRFGPGRVALPRTTDLHVARAPAMSEAED